MAMRRNVKKQNDFEESKNGLIILCKNQYLEITI
jgi:hypothetical protein